MAKTIFTLVLFITLISNLYSQTGPAGVGSSSNNVLWLKADAGTSTALEGIPVSKWNDQSGNSIHVSQSNLAQQPVYRGAVINGFPAIEFDNTNTAGLNDMFTAPDNSLLDNTNGYSFFTVTRMKNLDGGTARSIVSKRTTIDTDEAFMLFYYTSNYFYTDIDGLSDRFNTPSPAYANNTNYIMDVVYDGTLPAASRSSIYEGETLRKTSTESSSSVPDKVSPLVLGATHASDNRAFGGYMSEVIIYRTALNPASRIIVNNYLSAKYNIAISANDKYVGDNAGNGDYDFEVTGVGQESTGNNSAFASSVSGGFGLTAVGGLDNTDYILAGHATLINGVNVSDVGGMTGTSNARWQRIWYVDVTNTSTNISTNIEFDMSDGGIGSFSGSITDYVLLYRSAQSGNWTELTTASTLAGDKVQFNSISLAIDGYYTLGNKNYNTIALPVELVSFSAVQNSGKIDLLWATASEKNSKYFTVEKSSDGINFETLSVTDGAGNSNSSTQYSATDFSPYAGLSYYRLKQTDYNGDIAYSSVITSKYIASTGISVYPSPANSGESFYLTMPSETSNKILVVVRDIQGREFYSKIILDAADHQLVAVSPEPALASGIYIVVASSDNNIYSQKIIVR